MPETGPLSCQDALADGLVGTAKCSPSALAHGLTVSVVFRVEKGEL